MKISLVTIVKDRAVALANLIEGLSNGCKKPDELIIVHMNENIQAHQSDEFLIRSCQIISVEKLPLAMARNYAFKQASNNYVIFLDVDCIPDKDLISQYEKAFTDADILHSGRVMYLSESAMQQRDLMKRLSQYATADPVRRDIDQYPYELFWSLNFGCSRAVFEKIGGFDESFVGYGAEDTDFAFSARAACVKMNTIDAHAYHQYHPSYAPPLNHFIDIIKNAIAFKQKWYIWPMEGWLKSFSEMGLVNFKGDEIEVIRLPHDEEISAALKH